MKKDAFAKKMAQIDNLAKEQGAKTKRERVMFQIGWTFGFAEIITTTREKLKKAKS